MIPMVVFAGGEVSNHRVTFSVILAPWEFAIENLVLLGVRVKYFSQGSSVRRASEVCPWLLYTQSPISRTEGYNKGCKAHRKCSLIVCEDNARWTFFCKYDHSSSFVWATSTCDAMAAASCSSFLFCSEWSVRSVPLPVLACSFFLLVLPLWAFFKRTCLARYTRSCSQTDH